MPVLLNNQNDRSVDFSEWVSESYFVKVVSVEDSGVKWVWRIDDP